MNVYMFGCGPGHLTDEAREIAESHNARLVNYTEPDGGQRHWFSTRNYGYPFDARTARAVLADIEAAGGCAEER